MTVAEALKMTPAERMQSMESLWEALRQDEEQLDSPAWHEPILSERRRSFESGEAELLTIQQLKERLRR